MGSVSWANGFPLEMTTQENDAKQNDFQQVEKLAKYGMVSNVTVAGAAAGAAATPPRLS